jgi:hypothetical protein
MRVPLVALVAAGLFAASAGPANAQQRTIYDKDPAIALGFAWLCPGCGHLYSGETVKGALIAGISVGSIAAGAAIQLRRMADVDCGSPTGRSDIVFTPLTPEACLERNASFTPILVGGAIGLAGYVYGLIDAGPSVRRMRAKDGFGFGRIEVKPTLALDGAVGAQFTLRRLSNP